MTEMLLRRREPKTGENLMGYVLALTERNGYASLSWIFESMGLSPMMVSNKCWIAYKDGLGVEALSALTGVNTSLLLPLYYRPGAIVEGERGSHLKNYVFGQLVWRYVIRGWEPKICPACLQEDGKDAYTRALWDISAVTACPFHKVLLLERCSACDSRIRWSRTKLCVCKCEADWREFEGIPVDDKEVEISRHIHRLCGLLPDSPPAGPSPILSESLQGFLSGLFLVASQYQECFDRGVGSKIGADLTGKYLAASSNNQDLHVILNKAFEAFTDWPNSYFEFLDWRMEHGRRSELHSGLQHYFGGFYHNLFRRASPDMLNFMREGFRVYAAENWTRKYTAPPPKFTEGDLKNMGYLKKRTVRERLKIDVRFFNELVRQEKLKVLTFNRGRQIYRVVEAAGVEKLEREVGQFIDLPQVTAKLGFKLKGIMSLVNDGLLVLARGIANGENSYLFPESSIEGLMNDLRGCVRSDAIGAETVAFDEAFMQSGREGCKLSAFIRAILDGELIPCAFDETAGIRGLVFKAEESTAYAGLQWLKRKGDLIYISDAAKMLGVKQRAAHFLREKGLLPAEKAGPTMRVGYVVSREDVERFRETYMHAVQLAERFGVPATRVSTLLRESGIQPVTGPKIDGGVRYFFRRVDIEALELKKAA